MIVNSHEQSFKNLKLVFLQRQQQTETGEFKKLNLGAGRFFQLKLRMGGCGFFFFFFLVNNWYQYEWRLTCRTKVGGFVLVFLANFVKKVMRALYILIFNCETLSFWPNFLLFISRVHVLQIKVFERKKKMEFLKLHFGQGLLKLETKTKTTLGFEVLFNKSKTSY